MMHGDFEDWFRNNYSCCYEQYEINELCRGDSESGNYTFYDDGVQKQWEAWQACEENYHRKLKELITCQHLGVTMSEAYEAVKKMQEAAAKVPLPDQMRAHYRKFGLLRFFYPGWWNYYD